MSKLKLAFYWASSCGGCEIAVLDLAEKILDVAAVADIVFWPVALDCKYSDVEAMPDKSIDVCLFNGAIRTSENEHLAHLLRAKSKVLVAFGSCAHMGGVPSLANAFDRESILARVYKETPSTDNPDGTLPQTAWASPCGALELPAFYDTVKTLGQTVPVEYYVPGCPPAVPQIWNVVQAIATGNLPPVGSVIGAGNKTVCDECKRVKGEKKVKAFHRPSEVKPEPERCLLEQGIICLGPATRSGCGALCLDADMPCRGCYGPAEGVTDQGAKMLGALASIVDTTDPEEVQRILSQVVDPMGTFYRFGLASSILHRTRLPATAALATAKEK